MAELPPPQPVSTSVYKVRYLASSASVVYPTWLLIMRCIVPPTVKCGMLAIENVSATIPLKHMHTHKIQSEEVGYIQNWRKGPVTLLYGVADHTELLRSYTGWCKKKRDHPISLQIF